jgi:hypothetical protein
MATKTEGSKASQANMDVDYVMSYRFHNTGGLRWLAVNVESMLTVGC